MAKPIIAEYGNESCCWSDIMVWYDTQCRFAGQMTWTGMYKKMCGRLLNYSTRVLYEQYVTGCFSSMIISQPCLPMRWVHGWTSISLEWQQEHKLRQNVQKDKRVFFFLLMQVLKKKILRWTRDKARLPSCYGNSYTPVRLFVEGCAVISDKQLHIRLQITHIHQQNPHENVTMAITLKEK